MQNPVLGFFGDAQRWDELTNYTRKIPKYWIGSDATDQVKTLSANDKQKNINDHLIAESYLYIDVLAWQANIISFYRMVEKSH